jgi:hypothetical protein
MPLTYPGAEGVRREEGWRFDCSRRLPRAGFQARERCDAHAQNITLPSAPNSYSHREYGYRCIIYYRPGTNAHPNTRSWYCARGRFRAIDVEDGVRYNDPDSYNWSYWLAPRTKYYWEQKFTTLRRCLTRSYRRER